MTQGVAASDGSSHYGSHAATPELVRSGVLNTPGSAFSSFSPFISPNYIEAVMMKEGMTMTPAMSGSVTHSLEAPQSWEAVDSKMLDETFSFGETPSRKLDDFLEASSSTGPKLPATEDLESCQTKLEKEQELDDVNEDDEVPTIQSSFSFSDVLSHDDCCNASKFLVSAAVTDSGPLQMRLKSTNKDLSTHHFDAWQSPIGNLSQGKANACP